MRPFTQYIYVAILCLFALVSVGCSATRHSHDPEQVRTATRPALSLAMQQPDIVVAVSPVRQTMQIGGSIPTVLGAGISAVQDGQHAEAVKAALGDYDMRSVFIEGVERAMARQFGGEIERIPPQGTSAGYANAREARDARLTGLRRAGYDVVIDIDLSFGVYGPEGILAVKAAGELIDVPSGRAQWRNEIAWYSTELFADVRWRDPMQRATPNIMSPRFSIGEDAVGQWTRNNAEPLRTAFERAVEYLAAAILADLGLEETPEGLYTLGAYQLLNRRYPQAAEAFTRAIDLAPDMRDAANGLSVALAGNGQVEEAVALAEEIADAAPDYLPAQYNLAWWHAVEQQDPAQARPYYEKALALGAAPSRRLERAMKNSR